MYLKHNKLHTPPPTSNGVANDERRDSTDDNGGLRNVGSSKLDKCRSLPENGRRGDLRIRVKTGGIRLQSLIDSGKVPFRGGVCLDCYNQQVFDKVFVTITTRIDNCNHYWITQVIENE